LGEEEVLAYLDDLIFHANNPETHLKLLKLLFQAYRESGIKLNANKTFVFRKEVEYLGHMVSKNRIKQLP